MSKLFVCFSLKKNSELLNDLHCIFLICMLHHLKYLAVRFECYRKGYYIFGKAANLYQ